LEAGGKRNDVNGHSQIQKSKNPLHTYSKYHSNESGGVLIDDTARHQRTPGSDRKRCILDVFGKRGRRRTAGMVNIKE
jgi:hypothetical protein